MSTLIGDLDPSVWPASNRTNPHTRTALVLAIIIPQAILVTVFCTGRIVSKVLRKSEHALGADDWLMVFSGILILGVDFLGCYSTEFGSGYHTWDVDPAWIIPWGKIDFATYWLFIPSLAFTKISICLSYLRLFPSQTNHWFCWSMIIIQSIWVLAFLFVLAFACQPMSAFWLARKQKENCIDLKIILLFQAFFNSATDFLVFLWPLRILWRIQLPLHRRIGLVVTFGFGCLGCLAGALRAWLLHRYFESNDPFWITAALWCIVGGEGNFGVVCGCLPTLKPVAQRLFPRMFSDTIETSSSRAGFEDSSTKGTSQRQWTQSHAAEYQFQNISRHSHSSSRQSNRRIGSLGSSIGRCLPGPSTPFSLDKDSGSSSSDTERLRMRPDYDDGQYEVFAGRASSRARHGHAMLPSSPPSNCIKLTHTITMRSEKNKALDLSTMPVIDDDGSEELILHSSGSSGRYAFRGCYYNDNNGGSKTNTTI